MPLPLIPLISSVVGIAKNFVESKQKRSTAKLEADLEVHKALTQAKIEKIAAEQAADIAWENTSITQSGWKDEYWTLILSIPLILCFVPGMDGYVASGFAALNVNTPEWYQYALGVAIASSFGYRKLMDFMKLKRGS